MKYLLLIIALVAAGYFYNRHLESQENAAALNTLFEQLENEQAIDLFPLKKALVKQVYSICDGNQTYLLETGRTVIGCYAIHDEKKPQCDTKVFRLAPMKLNNKQEALEYSQDYIDCTLPYDDLSFEKIAF